MKTKVHKFITTISVVLVILCNSSCKDFLNVVPKDQLTGNNFYKSKDDVESNMSNLYSSFFDKINETAVIGSIGEYRAGEVFVNPDHFRVNEGRMVEALGQNDLIKAINDGAWRERYHLNDITNWTRYYQVIQGANILIVKLNEGISGVTAAEQQQYIAEATFIRCFTYFWMVRIYGDVSYYTNAYQAEPLGREPMVSVLNKCIVDLKGQMNSMPWTNPDPSKRGSRASRGAAAALLMHMNMWMNSNAFSLLPLANWDQVVKGRSAESLFEFYRSINYGDQVNIEAPVASQFLRWPYKNPRYDNQVSLFYFLPEYMTKLFPPDVADKRKETLENDGWFGDQYGGGVYSGEEGFVMTKFAHNIPAAGNSTINPDNTFLIFRYSDAILLAAEANAALDQDGEATRLVNIVRQRAQATPYSGGGGANLKDFIFLERGRELIGEGSRYFDLVRTGRIMSTEWAKHPLNRDQYNRRAWTWPVDRSALNNNPFMTLNAYWLGVGN
jgi:hypothetical protein